MKNDFKFFESKNVFGEKPLATIFDERINEYYVKLAEAQLKDGELWSLLERQFKFRYDVSDGGLLVALAEMAIAGNIGAKFDAAPASIVPHAWWFGEDQGRYLVTVPDVAAFQAQLAKGTRDADTASSGVRRIGTTGGDSLFGATLADMREASESFFRDWMEV